MANTVLTANVSPQIPLQFPGFYQEDYPNYIAFVQAYFQWLEQEGNAQYYARRIYDIKDIDNTFDQFIVYFKEKYLKNIQFTTVANIRTVIKHALDIYRSKGTERCDQLIFQLAFDVTPQFYYPSQDLFSLSSGQWYIPTYIELTDNWPVNSTLQHKEIMGAFSGATAFVDNIIRRYTNGRLEDVAYISAITGNFQTGEKIVPNDGSVAIASAPSMTGSLSEIVLPLIGTGNNYVVGELIPISSINGSGGVVLVTNTINQTGAVAIQFEGGGFGYSFSQQQANLTYSNATAQFANGTNIYTYNANGVLDGIALVNNAPTMISNAGVMTVNVLSGNINYTNIYTFNNAASAVINLSDTGTVNITPNVIISNATLTISNATMTTANLEIQHPFEWLDQLTEPMATYNYINANGSFVVGANLYLYSNTTHISGQGVIMNINASNTTSGVLVISVTSGNVVPNSSVNAITTFGNAIGANLTGANGYVNTTATGNFVANLTSIVLHVTNTAPYSIGEKIMQSIQGTTFILPSIVPEQKIGGYGTANLIINSTAIQLGNVVGRFTNGVVLGLTSNAFVNTTGFDITFGIINISSNSFVTSPYALINSPYLTGTLTAFSEVSGTSGFSINVVNAISNSENVNISYDLLADFANVALAATTYGFPANPNANATTGTLLSAMNFLNANVGALANVFVLGETSSFASVPFILIDNAVVSASEHLNDRLQLTTISGQFQIGELITQAATGAQGQYLGGNTSFANLVRMFYANDFVATTNSTTTVVGALSGATANVESVDYDFFSQPMGRNALIGVEYVTGNNVLVDVSVQDSGFGFVNGEFITIGSNGAVGQAVVTTQGMGTGFYLNANGFLSDVKKLFDGYFYQHFSYEIISPLLMSKYQQMLFDLSHVAGTKMFGKFVYNAQTSVTTTASLVSFNSQDYELTDEGTSFVLTDETGNNTITAW